MKQKNLLLFQPLLSVAFTLICLFASFARQKFRMLIYFIFSFFGLSITDCFFFNLNGKLGYLKNQK